MVKQFSARADAHVKPAVHASALFEQKQMPSPPPTVFECDLEKSLYLAALSDTRIILKNLAELRATRVSKSMVNFLSKHEVFSPLLARLTKNYWLSLTHEEKSRRAYIRQKTFALKREKELLDGISVRKKIAKKFFKAHQRKMPIRLSEVELAWLESNPECRAVVTLKSKFLIPTSCEPFDFSDEAFARLATRLRYEMLTPSDVSVLKAHGVPILPDNTLSLDDAAWAREPYTKAVLYRLVKYRKDEQDAQTECLKSVSLPREKAFKRIHLSEEDVLAEPIMTPHFHPSQVTEYAAQTHITPVRDAQPKLAQFLKRVELESDGTPCEIINSDASSQRRWIEEVKEKVRTLFGITTKMRALAG
ncbi:MAG: hypothetical protein SNJ55_11715 [Chloroherpetonaceae bacterium]